jgi:hypothetical protein
MVSFFGSWFGDMSIILFLVFLFVAYYFFFNKKNKRDSDKAALVVSLAAFLVSAGQIWGTISGDIFRGTSEGYWLFLLVAIISLIVLLKEVTIVFGEHKVD